MPTKVVSQHHNFPNNKRNRFQEGVVSVAGGGVLPVVVCCRWWCVAGGGVLPTKVTKTRQNPIWHVLICKFLHLHHNAPSPLAACKQCIVIVVLLVLPVAPCCVGLLRWTGSCGSRSRKRCGTDHPGAVAAPAKPWQPNSCCKGGGRGLQCVH